MRRLSAGLRVLVFDKRGIGMSDRLTEAVDLETRMDDVGAVMDAAGVERAALLGWGTGGSAMAAFFPRRIPSVPSRSSSIRSSSTGGSPTGPMGRPRRSSRRISKRNSPFGVRRLPEATTTRPTNPGSPHGTRAREVRGDTRELRGVRAHPLRLDVTDILPAIRVRRSCSRRRERLGEPGRRRVRRGDGSPVLGPSQHLASGPSWVDEPEPFVAAIESFLGLEPPCAHSRQVLSTVLFTDIVGSTVRAAELGDAAWKALLATHDERAKTEIERHRGRYIHTTGDGLLATFDGPARAVRCAQAICEAVRRSGSRSALCHPARSSSPAMT